MTVSLLHQITQIFTNNFNPITMKNIVKINTDQLKTMLETWSFGAQPISLQYITDADMNASNKRLFPFIKKIANVGGMIGYVYQNSINNELARENKEADFLAQPLWNGKGKRISTALSTHTEKGTFYLTLKHQQTFKSIFLDTESLTVYSHSQLKDYLKPYVAPANQGVNEGKEIHHREISLGNIRRLKLKGTTYLVEI